jgi:hypothetical protein
MNNFPLAAEIQSALDHWLPDRPHSVTIYHMPHIDKLSVRVEWTLPDPRPEPWEGRSDRLWHVSPRSIDLVNLALCRGDLRDLCAAWVDGHITNAIRCSLASLT